MWFLVRGESKRASPTTCAGLARGLRVGGFWGVVGSGVLVSVRGLELHLTGAAFGSRDIGTNSKADRLEQDTALLEGVQVTHLHHVTGLRQRLVGWNGDVAGGLPSPHSPELQGDTALGVDPFHHCRERGRVLVLQGEAATVGRPGA